ncbi:MAG TPA: sugar ABC transporter ATP-binding protein [Kaistia sp.]|nr:sugar ABC transporter ATP-binding protein [Kaistia sp.]
MRETILEASGITKRFAGVTAVNRLDLTIAAGEVHCLVGENGAGKSTMIKMISGQYVPDEGELRLFGKPVHFRGPLAARDAGISVIHQELQLIPQMTIAENIVLGRWPRRAGAVDFDKARSIAASILPTIGLEISVDTRVEELSTGQQQLVEIARALAFQSKLLILDEPTASLSNAEADRLMELVGELRRRNLGILYVSHRLEEVFELGDRVTVVRDGKRIGTEPIGALDQAKVVAMMVGDQRSLQVAKDRRPGATILKVDGLTRNGIFSDISLEVRRGEIVGLAGLIGAGRTDVARCLFGVEQPDAGRIEVDGKAVSIASPRAAIDLGFALVPEDRKTQGLILIGSVTDNLALSVHPKISHAGWISAKAEGELVAGYIRKLQIRAPSPNHAVETLSGGNQQKVVLARWLATGPRLMILDEPTRGVDVGAKAEIHRVIEELVREGLGVLLISSELPELMAMSDRVYVMRAGRIAAELVGPDINEEIIMKHAAGATQ